MVKVYEWFGGRKYFACSVVYVVSTAMLIFNKITSEHYVDLSLWTLGIYAGFNVFEKYVAKQNETK